MEIIRDALIALFAAIGVASAVWMTADALFSIGRKKMEKFVALVPVSGEAPALERTVSLLLRTRCGGNCFGKVILLDCGMNTESRAEAILLASQYGDVEVCACEAQAEEIAKNT